MHRVFYNDSFDVHTYSSVLKTLYYKNILHLFNQET